MIAVLKEYNNPQKYETDSPIKIEYKKSISVALKEAKLKIRELRGTSEFVGFKIYDKYGRLKCKLPGY